MRYLVLIPLTIFAAMFAPTTLYGGGGLHKGTNTITLYSPDVLGNEYTGSFVEVNEYPFTLISSGHTENSLFSWTVTGIEN